MNDFQINPCNSNLTLSAEFQSSQDVSEIIFVFSRLANHISYQKSRKNFLDVQIAFLRQHMAFYNIPGDYNEKMFSLIATMQGIALFSSNIVAIFFVLVFIFSHQTIVQFNLLIGIQFLAEVGCTFNDLFYKVISFAF